MINSGPRILHTHRQTVHVLERAKVYVEDDRILYQRAESGSLKSFNIPFANLSVLLLGQGTSLSNDAARLLGKEGVYVAFTGTGGTPLHHGSLTNYQVTEHLHKMIAVVGSQESSLEAARIIMRTRCSMMETLPRKIGKGAVARFGKADVAKFGRPFLAKCDQAKSASEIMGYEGNFAKTAYGQFARVSGLKDFKRKPGEAKSNNPIEIANSRIDHGNYLAYGIAGAVLWALGIPPAMSVLHGKTRAGGLVFDLADSFKDALVLPIAFSQFSSEQEFRANLISAIQNQEIMKSCFDTMSKILKLGEPEATS